MIFIITGVMLLLYVKSYGNVNGSTHTALNNFNYRYSEENLSSEQEAIDYDNLCHNNRHVDGVWKLKHHHNSNGDSDKSFFCCGWDLNG